MKLVVFGLSISSSWGNGHATTYRARRRPAAARGHDVAFYEWNAPWYASNRDHPDPPYLDLHLYESWDEVAPRALAEARDADAVIVGSYVNEGPRVIDALADAGVDPLFFYDIDTPVTVAALRGGGAEYLRTDQVPLFTRYLSFTGGPFLRDVVEGELGAREAVPLYCSVDGERYHPSKPDRALACDLAYMGTYAADRQPVVEKFLLDVAGRLPRRRFIVAGPQYPAELAWPANVRHLHHLEPAHHPRFYSSAAWQLNATRADMVAAGWSPSVRLFEAAACGAAMISDRWPGLDHFFTPGKEILLPQSTEEVVEMLETTHGDDRAAIGQAARARILAEHTAEHRAEEMEACVGEGVLSAEC
jgi:spore maturation protein CgeB